MLIGAVRGGHVEIVRALLHKYADIDIRGQVSSSVLLFPFFSNARELHHFEKHPLEM